jgi:hypothetical protein
MSSKKGGAGYQVSALLWNGVVSNIIRNIGMHLATPIGPVNDAIGRSDGQRGETRQEQHRQVGESPPPHVHATRSTTNGAAQK